MCARHTKHEAAKWKALLWNIYAEHAIIKVNESSAHDVVEFSRFIAKSSSLMESSNNFKGGIHAESESKPTKMTIKNHSWHVNLNFMFAELNCFAARRITSSTFISPWLIVTGENYQRSAAISGIFIELMIIETPLTHQHCLFCASFRNCTSRETSQSGRVATSIESTELCVSSRLSRSRYLLFA